MDTQIRKTWKSTANIGCTLVMLALPFSPARGDAVSDWSAIAARMASSSGQSQAAQELAAFHAAMFETMNFVEGKYVPRFLVKPPAPLGTSGEVEAIGAAHYVLTQIYPEQKAALDAALERSLAAFPDWDATSRARIWGMHLGGNVYGLSAPQRSSKGADVPTARNSKSLQPRRSTGESGTGGETWNSIATRSIEGRTHQPIERARIYALVSLAASKAYSALDDAKAGYGAVGAAVRVVLESELGSAEEKAPEAYLMHVRDDGDKSRSAKADEEMGKNFGLQALTYYRRIK